MPMGSRITPHAARQPRGGPAVSAFAQAWDALGTARRALGRGDIRGVADAATLALAVATRNLLSARGLPPTVVSDLGTSRAICEIVLGDSAGRLAESACDLEGLRVYPQSLLGPRDIGAARVALDSSAALVALIESEVLG